MNVRCAVDNTNYTLKNTDGNFKNYEY